MKKSLKTFVAAALLMFSYSAIAQERVNLPAKNPWLTNSVYPTSHHNPGQTDASPIAGPTQSKDLEKGDVKTVLGLFNSQPVTKIMGKDRVLIAAGILRAA